MLKIIKAAAEAKYPDDPNTFAHINNYRKEFIDNVIDGVKALKSNGYELLRLEEDEQLVQSIRQKKNAYGHSRSTEQMIEEALALGAAKERERMKGVFENASEDGWKYFPADRLWRRLIKNTNPVLRSMGRYEERTTDELIKLYENKEG